MIVAPTGFTEISLNAVHYAADMALKVNMDLLVVHVSPLPMLFSEVPTPEYERLMGTKQAEAQMALLKEKLIARVHNRIRIITEVREGEFLEQITACCAHIRPFAVVIGGEGMGPYARALFGGKTMGLLSHLNWPLIIVPPGTPFRDLSRIGLACDLKQVAKTLPARNIRDFVKGVHGYLHVLHVSTGADHGSGHALRQETEWLEELLRDLEPQFHFIQHTDIADAVCACAAKLKLDVLLVVPKKHDLLSRIFHRSISRQMVLHAPLPVLALHE